MGVPHPIPYQGSKRKLASAILSFFPSNVSLLIEPFAGSAAVSLFAAHSGKINRYILNDLNKPLIDLWNKIINQPEEITALYSKLWVEQKGKEREYYDCIRNSFNRTYQPEYFLYLLARCVKASVRYNSNGEFNQSPDNRRLGSNPETMKQHIYRASQLLRDKTMLTCRDYKDVLYQASPKDVVYMDPPYQGVCSQRDPRYLQGLLFNSFVEALQQLNKRDISYIVSYDGRTDNKTFGQRLPDFLELKYIEIPVGRSSQATLLGRNSLTYESLYLSPALISRIELPLLRSTTSFEQLPLFGISA